MKKIFLLLTIILIGVGGAMGQTGPTPVPFGAKRTVDTSTTEGNMKVKGAVRTPIYATSDTDDVLGFDAAGNWVLRKKSTGGGGGSTTFAGLSDVEIIDVDGGQLVKYNEGTLMWENFTPDYVQTSGSYSNPSWITGLGWSKITGTPTTVAGYGITDPFVFTSGSYANPAWITSLAWGKLTGVPTTLSGYGITDPIVLTSGSYANPAWITSLAYAKLTGAPTIYTTFAGLTDVNFTSIADGQLVRWDAGTSKFVNFTPNYISSYTETDPVFLASAAAGILPSDISEWDAKLSADLLDGHFWVGNAADDAIAVLPTGNVTFDRDGVFTIGALQVTNGMLAGSIAYSKLLLLNSIVDADVAVGAGITYGKLNLAGNIVNADINASAAIAYSKLNLSGGIVNADVNASAAIAYSKLNLTGGIVNADINASAAIAYSKLNLNNSIVNADIVNSTINLTTKVTGVLPEANGGTNQNTYALGDVLYASATNTLSKLAGNTTTTKKFLRQTGNGSVSAAPAWDVLVAGDVPDLSATYAALTGATFTGAVIIPVLSVNNQTGTTYTTVLGDAGKWVSSNNASAVTFTIPLNSSVAYATNTYISFVNYGAGKLTIAATGGVTINGTDANRAFVQYAGGYIQKRGTDTWIIGGKTSN